MRVSQAVIRQICPRFLWLDKGGGPRRPARQRFVIIKVERAFELAQLDLRQADVDVRQADAVNKLLRSLESVPRACVRAGSVLVIKYPDPASGEPIVIVRNLSQLELHAPGSFPAVQKSPEGVLEALTMAIESLAADGRLRSEGSRSDKPSSAIPHCQASC